MDGGYDLAFPPTRSAVLAARENRFAVRTGEGKRLHLPNSGRLRFLVPGTPILYLPRENPKTSGRVILAKDRGVWVLLDSSFAERALPALLPRLGYRFLRPQPAYADGRFDALVEAGGRVVPLEMKSATHVEGRLACFPDAKSARARRHLRDLVEAGGVLLFAVLHPLGRAFAPCRFDPGFAQALREAAGAGLKIHAVRAEIEPGGLRWGEALPVYFSP